MSLKLIVALAALAAIASLAFTLYVAHGIADMQTRRMQSVEQIIER